MDLEQQEGATSVPREVVTFSVGGKGIFRDFGDTKTPYSIVETAMLEVIIGRQDGGFSYLTGLLQGGLIQVFKILVDIPFIFGYSQLPGRQGFFLNPLSWAGEVCLIVENRL